MKREQRLKRKDVPKKSTWDLTALFSDRNAWKKELQAIEKDVEKITAYKNHLAENAKTLFDCLKNYEVFEERIIQVATYATLKFNADGSDPLNQQDAAKVSSVIAKINATLSFIETEILSIPEEKIEKFLNENKELTTYEKMLKDLLARKPYTLLPEVEKSLAALSEIHDSPYMIYQRSKSADMEFSSITDEEGNSLPMSFALYEDKYEVSPNTHIRREAYKSFTNTLKRYKNTYAAIYATEVNKQVTLTRLRGYSSTTEMLLQPQQVTEEMYHQQLDIIQQKLAPHMQRYIQLKKERLGLNKMKFCDLQVSIDPNFQPETTYDEATDIILEALEIMGPEYRNIMEKAIKNRWIDYADNIGKSTGAFCASPYEAHPYILMTWTNTMRGAFILAHELGHAGHFYLANKEQNLLNTRVSRYFVEAPSTLNELLLAHHLLEKHKDERMKRWVIDQLLSTYYHNFVTHLLEGEFQRRIYNLAEQGIPLTENILSEQKKETLESFWGDTVTIDEGASLTWMRQPHYYMGLYPYTYSAGLTISTVVARNIQEKGKPAVDQWLNVLKAGGTLNPLQLSQKAGVEMNQPDAIHEAVSYVGSLINQLSESFE